MSEVGILINPAAGRDVRRLISGATSVSLSEHGARLQRLLVGLGALGVKCVSMMFDRAGIAGGLLRARERNPSLPAIRVIDMPVKDRPFDTQLAVRHMRQAGAGCIVGFGGDGTHRLVAHECGPVPLVCLSSGTNNAFPKLQEETVAGLVAAAVARQLVETPLVCCRNKRLRCFIDGKEGISALVDVCVTDEAWVGTRALWRPENLVALYLAFSEPGAIGLSAIGSLVAPVARTDDAGTAIHFGPGRTINVPIAPGLIRPVEIAKVGTITLGERVPVPAQTGTIALDGEKEIIISPKQRVEIELTRDGPWSVDITAAMAAIAQRGLLAHTSGLQAAV